MSEHISVMLNETLELLDVKKGGIYIDGTLGRGGHSREILKRLGDGKLYCFDLDSEAIKESRENLKDYDNVTFVHDNYCHMHQYVEKVDGILLDLGVSSPQFDEGERGFSYRFDGPLDMRMDQEKELTAAKIVNEYSKEELANIFWNYGEEKFSRPIADKICRYRENKKIESTFELADIIKSALPAKVLSKKGHPAKQVFQALRIAVNGELDSLEYFLDHFEEMSHKGTRVVIITFHSLEDRLVKQKFKKLSTVEDDLSVIKLPDEIEKAKWRLVNRHIITAGEDELSNNPRSKPAKLRGIEKIED